MERSTILNMKYNEMLNHAKTVGINLVSSKPKKDELIEQVTSYLDNLELESHKETKKLRTRPQVASYSENIENETKKPKKKLKKKKEVEEEEEEKVAGDEESTKKKPKKKLSKASKSKKKPEMDENVPPEADSQEPAAKKLVKPKKSSKTKRLKDTETDEMKRVRKSIADKKILMQETSKKKLKKPTEAAATDSDQDNKSTEKFKELSNSIANSNDSRDTSPLMKRRILSKKKKKSASPAISRASRRTRSVDNRETEPEQAQEVNQANETPVPTEPEAELDEPMTHEQSEPTIKPARKSVAFVISHSPETVTTPKIRTPAFNNKQTRKSITFVIENSPAQATNKTYSIDTTDKPLANDQSSIMTNDESNDANGTITFEKTDEPPVHQQQPAAAEEAKPKGRPRIVIPTKNVKVIEKVIHLTCQDTNDDVVVKKIHVSQGGPRIVKPANLPEAQKKPTTTAAAAKKPIHRPESAKATVRSSKMPDFKAIHNKNFNKGENLAENMQRVQQRHAKLSGAKSDDNTSNASTEATISASLLGHASNLLRKIVPFPKEDSLPKTDKPKDTSIPKIKTAADKVDREPFTTSFRPRTPLSTRQMNTLRNTPVQGRTPSNHPKTPQSTNKPKPISLLRSASKPVYSKPFQFQNKNLEANINLGNACQFGHSQPTGTTPLKQSAFNRRKSYNPAESIGRGLSYNPHVGKLKPVDGAGVNKPNLNESTSIKVPCSGAIEKRKSMLGQQRIIEKDKQNIKRKVMRNKEMDKPRVL